MAVKEKSEVGESRDSVVESRVLLIGHDGHAEEGLERQLTSLHCSYVHAAGSADALRLLRRSPYSVVITDPDTSIHEDLALVEEIQHLRPGVRVIVLASSGTPEEMIAALRQHVFLCQCAPFDMKDIARFAVSAIEA